jgi:hypothetical protein
VAFALRAPAVVVNAIVAFVEPAEMDRPEKDIPGTAREGLEPDGERGQDVRYVHPAFMPPNAAIRRDAPNLKVRWIRDRLPLRRVATVGRLLERRRPLLC